MQRRETMGLSMKSTVAFMEKWQGFFLYPSTYFKYKGGRKR